MTRFLLVLVYCAFSMFSYAQRECGSAEYAQKIQKRFPQPQREMMRTENTAAPGYDAPDTGVIIVPVVVHVVYFNQSQNISLQQIQSQINALNADFAAGNNDIQRIPSYFKSSVADAGIRFEMARVDPQGFATSGINRVKTATRYFSDDDKVKFAASGGVNAWDASKYLNIWVCDIDMNLMGYASFPGGPADRDGVVIDYTVFGTAPYVSGPYNKGRTLVHELGHWMGLKHIWGDYLCGDDGIHDTPQQQMPTRGCPSSQVFSACATNNTGNMYMNFMDFTNDACMYMFTNGQKAAMRAHFKTGGYRYALAGSDASVREGMAGGPVPEEPVIEKTQDVLVKLYPNPAPGDVTIDLQKCDVQFTSLQVFNHMGQQVFQQAISKTVTSIGTRTWKPGMYYIQLKGEGVSKREKFLKM